MLYEDYNEARVTGMAMETLAILYRVLRTNMLPDDMILDVFAITQEQLDKIRSELSTSS